MLDARLRRAAGLLRASRGDLYAPLAHHQRTTSAPPAHHHQRTLPTCAHRPLPGRFRGKVDQASRHSDQPHPRQAGRVADAGGSAVCKDRGHGAHPTPFRAPLRQCAIAPKCWCLCRPQTVEWDEMHFDVRLLQRVPVRCRRSSNAAAAPLSLFGALTRLLFCARAVRRRVAHDHVTQAPPPRSRGAPRQYASEL